MQFRMFNILLCTMQDKHFAKFPILLVFGLKNEKM